MNLKKPKSVILFFIIALVALSSSELFSNTGVYLNQANTTNGIINLSHNEDLIMPSALTSFSPDSIQALDCSNGVSYQYGYDSAVNSGAYRFVFSGSGYFTITFRYYRSIILETTSYTIWIAP